MTVDQLLKPDPPRDRYGRYLLRLPGDTKARGRTRVTTFIKALDQGDGLIAWKATATMVGALRNPGLHAKWAAIFAQSQDPWYHSDDLKTKCKKLVDECADHGGAQSRADLGTALHAMLELVARGETPHLVDPYKADVEAFQYAIVEHGLVAHPDWTEVTVYIEKYDLVGTFDLFIGICRPPDHPYKHLVLSDFKTETSTDYKALAHAAQLAAYSLATHRIIWPQDPDGEATLEPLPDFDHDTGLIIHLPAGQATCTLHAVDLNQGRQALELASSMRRFDAQRKRKDTGGLMRPWTGEPCPTVTTAKPAAAADTPPPNLLEQTGILLDQTGSTPTGTLSATIDGPSTSATTATMKTDAPSTTGLDALPLTMADSTIPTDLLGGIPCGNPNTKATSLLPCAGSPIPPKNESSSSASVAPASTTDPSPTDGPPTQEQLKARLRQIRANEPTLATLITNRWPITVGINHPWTPADTIAVAELLDEVDIEGPMLSTADRDRLTWNMGHLSQQGQHRVRQWVVEAASDPTRYRPLALGAGNHTTRRIALAETCLLIAGNEVSDVSFLNGIHAAYGGPALPIIGHALGQLNWRQAQHLLTLTRLHLNLNTTIESE